MKKERTVFLIDLRPFKDWPTYDGKKELFYVEKAVNTLAPIAGTRITELKVQSFKERGYTIHIRAYKEGDKSRPNI